MSVEKPKRASYGIGEYAMNTNTINSPVSITAMAFGRDMQPIPKRMEWAGRTYQFIDRGIRVVSRRGESIMSGSPYNGHLVSTVETVQYS